MTKKKDANQPSLMANIMTYAREYKWPFVAAVVLAMIGSISSIIGPDRLGDMTDKITEGLMSPDGIDPVSYTHLTLPTNREV